LRNRLLLTVMTDAARVKATIYVGGLDTAVSARTLADAFVPFGEIVDVSLPKPEAPSSTDPHRGFGYVEFELPGDAKEAIDNMDQSELYGRIIKVAAAKPQKESNEGLGSKTAIWEQVRVIQRRRPPDLRYLNGTNSLNNKGGLVGEACR